MRIPRNSHTFRTIDLRLLFAAIALVGAITAAPAPQQSAGTPAGWKTIKASKGSCQLSVPADWATMAGFGLASDPTKKATAAVNKDERHTWNELKATVKQTFKPTAIIEDSATHLEFKYGDNGLNYYAARPFSGFNCASQVMVNDPSAAEKFSGVSKQIVETLDKAQ